MELDLVFRFENIEIEATNRTPYVKLNKDEGFIEIKGKSIPENKNKFYWHFNRWVSEYVRCPADNTTVNIRLAYVNSSSLLVIAGFLKTLLNYVGLKSTITVNWFYEAGDEDMKDIGLFLNESTGFNMDIQEVQVI